MNINELFPVQAKLDDRIVEEHNLQGQDLFKYKVQALKVEIAELDNETKVFKFWSKKKMNREKALEEFVDCIHFAVSIANEIGYKMHTYKKMKPMDLTRLSLGLTNLVTLLPEAKFHRHIETVFHFLLQYGEQIGFSEDEVLAAYYEKNKENYKRQEAGY